MGFQNKCRKHFTWIMEQKPKIILEDQKGCIRGCEEFKHLGVKFDKEDRKK